MDNLKFELTNEDRKYLGLEPVQDNWERVKLSDTTYLYFEGNTIKKYIYISNDDYYLEAKMDYEQLKIEQYYYQKLIEEILKKLRHH